MMRTPGPDDKPGMLDFPSKRNEAFTPVTASQLAFGAALVSLLGMLPGLRPLLFFRFLAGMALAAACTLPPAQADQLSPLANPPNWSNLDPYQKTITRKDFARLVDQIYSPDGAFWKFSRIDDDKVSIYSDSSKKELLYTLRFAPSASAAAPLPYNYQTKATSTDSARPLKGIRIALDPGHIGGDWAQLEARYFKLGSDPSVEEAKLNMITCQRLAERLEADGAEVVWAKRGYEPTTRLRPGSLHREAIAALALRPGTTKSKSGQAAIERMIDNQAALLFYRVAEIRARADIVNKLHPDLTICVHYNADDWGEPDHPSIAGHSRLVIFVNGSYEGSELANDDVKYDMLRKLLDRCAAQEMRGCALVGQAMLDQFKYPAEDYNASFAHRVTDVPSVYTRNLLASHLYHGPVIYCEGPYMNAKDAYYRIIAGDYLGVKKIKGQDYPSVYRDYAESVEKGVLKYFGVKPSAPPATATPNPTPTAKTAASATPKPTPTPTPTPKPVAKPTSKPASSPKPTPSSAPESHTTP